MSDFLKEVLWTHFELNTVSGLSRDNVQVIELHDCFSCNELITYEALGLCPPGMRY